MSGLAELLPHIPLDAPRLACEAYEDAICSCLDAPGGGAESGPLLLSILRRWPPTEAVEEAVLEPLLVHSCAWA